MSDEVARLTLQSLAEQYEQMAAEQQSGGSGAPDGSDGADGDARPPRRPPTHDAGHHKH